MRTSKARTTGTMKSLRSSRENVWDVPGEDPMGVWAMDALEKEGYRGQEIISPGVYISRYDTILVLDHSEKNIYYDHEGRLTYVRTSARVSSIETNIGNLDKVLVQSRAEDVIFTILPKTRRSRVLGGWCVFCNSRKIKVTQYGDKTCDYCAEHLF